MNSLLDRMRDLARAAGRLASACAAAVGWWFEGTRQIGSQMRDGLELLGRAFLAVLIFPWTLVKAFGRGLQGLSRTGEVVEHSVSTMRKSVRSSVIDLQEAIESQPEVMKGRWRRTVSWLFRWFRSLPAWQRHGLRAVVALGVLAVASAYPAWRWFKGWRAQQFLGEARILLEEGRTIDAFYKGQAAYNLAPGNPDVLTEMVELGRAVRHPQTLFWGQRLLNRKSGEFVKSVEAQEHVEPWRSEPHSDDEPWRSVG